MLRDKGLSINMGTNKYSLRFPEQNPKPESLDKHSAQQEAIAFQDESLEEQSQKAQHKRREVFRDLFLRAACIGFWAAFGGALVLFLYWIIHLMLPLCWHWATPEQLDKIQTLLFTGAMATVVTIMRKTYLDDSAK